MIQVLWPIVWTSRPYHLWKSLWALVLENCPCQRKLKPPNVLPSVLFYKSKIMGYVVQLNFVYPNQTPSVLLWQYRILDFLFHPSFYSNVDSLKTEVFFRLEVFHIILFSAMTHYKWPLLTLHVNASVLHILIFKDLF